MNGQVLWWNVRKEITRRRIAIPITLGLAFGAALAWTEVSIRSEAGIDMVRLAVVSVSAVGILLAFALIITAVVMRRYSYQVAAVIGNKGFNALVWTTRSLSLLAIALGILIHGGRFGHIDVLLKIIGIAKGK